MGPKETRPPFECNEGCTADRRLFDLYAVIKSDKRSGQVSRQSGRRGRRRGRHDSQTWADILACTRSDSSPLSPANPPPPPPLWGAKNSQGHMLCGTPLSHPSSSSDTSCIIHIKIQTDIRWIINAVNTKQKKKEKKLTDHCCQLGHSIEVKM